jgi:peptidoglycan/LPS O-acetylase OafA/YrhL
MLYFLPAHHIGYYRVYDILWSLSIEEHFYICFPLLLSLLYRTEKILLIVLGLAILGCLLVRVYNMYSIPSYELATYINYHATHTRADAIIYGCLLAVIFYAVKPVTTGTWISSFPAFITGLFLLLFALVYRNPIFRETYRYSIQGIGLLHVLPFIIARRHHTWVKTVFENRSIVLIGKLSYSLYLFHWLAIQVVTTIMPVYSVAWYMLTIAVTIGLSCFSYYAIEMPMIKWRRKFGSNV